MIMEGTVVQQYYHSIVIVIKIQNFACAMLAIHDFKVDFTVKFSYLDIFQMEEFLLVDQNFEKKDILIVTDQNC